MVDKCLDSIQVVNTFEYISIHIVLLFFFGEGGNTAM